MMKLKDMEFYGNGKAYAGAYSKEVIKNFIINLKKEFRKEFHFKKGIGML